MVKKLLPHVPLVFFGGATGRSCAMACYVPEYLPEDYLTSEDGPAAAVRAVYYEKDALTHRDFLGSLMGAGIKRETVGDIYVSAGQCDILVTRQILPYLLEQWDSAGRTKLHLSVIPLAEVQRPAVEKREIRDTVPSLRLDCLVGSAFSLARGPGRTADRRRKGGRQRSGVSQGRPAITAGRPHRRARTGQGSAGTGGWHHPKGTAVRHAGALDII